MTATQRQIRTYGGVMTRLNVYKDFRKFFESNPTGVYDGKLCSTGAAGELEQVRPCIASGTYQHKQYRQKGSTGSVSCVEQQPACP
jgi:hypothetical protein